MSRIRKNYSKEQKLEIVKLSLEENQTVTSLAERFDVSANTIYNWRSKYLKDREEAFPGKGNKLLNAEQREIERLKKELREAELERDILKKAVSIFSKTDRKFSNS